MEPKLEPATPGELVAGQVLDARYRLVEELARGGMGRVFAAVDTELHRKVAIKFIASPSPDATALRRFSQEALALARLSHPNVLTIYDVAPKGSAGAPYLVCELLEGRTLAERAASPLPLSEVLDIASQVAAGLAAAHEKEIVHRDLKPDNVFITRAGRVKLIDFGIAKLLLPPIATRSGDAPAEGEAAPPTAEGKIVGTVGYMAPEQIRGGPVDRRTDLFSFGAVLYELLAGRRPFQGATPYLTSIAVLDEAPAALPREVPAELREIVDRCLEKDPARRFSSADELLARLESARTAVRVRELRGRRGPWLFVTALLLLASGALFLRSTRTGASRPKTVLIAPVKADAADAQAAVALDLALERSFSALSHLVQIERTGSADWVLRSSLSRSGSGLRFLGGFEGPAGQRIGDPIEAAVSAGDLERDAEGVAFRLRDEFMPLWRDRLRRERAHRLARDARAEEKLLAYYNLMGPSARTEFIDRGRRLLDDSLAADPRYVPALAERSVLLRLAAGRPGDDPTEDLRLSRADAEEALRLSPGDPQALLAECLTARRQMRDWPSDRELTAATSACSDATQADPQSVAAVFALAQLYDQNCDDGPLVETLKLGLDRAARYDRSRLGQMRFYLVSVALQRGHLQEADIFSSQLIAQLAREERQGAAKGAPLQGAHLLRAAVLMRLGRGPEAEREIEAELARGAASVGGLDETIEAASLRGLARIRKGALDPARTARLAALEQRFALADERSDTPSLVVGWFGFMDPEGAAAWMEAHKTQPGCRLDFERAVIYRDAGHPDKAARALASCNSQENWVKRCAKVISSELPPAAIPQPR